MFLVHTTGYDFIKCLKKDTPILEIFKEALNRGIDIQAIKPQSKNTSLPFTFCVKVFDFRFLSFIKRIKTRMIIEQICDECEIQFRISRDKGTRRKVLSTIQFVRILENLLGSLKEISCLQWSTRTLRRVKLIEKDSIILTILNILAEIGNS